MRRATFMHLKAFIKDLLFILSLLIPFGKFYGFILGRADVVAHTSQQGLWPMEDPCQTIGKE